ncbi:MAG TPA: tRNA (cytidine(34)-2'-O)-methyltransferase [Chthoniobacterales bacterium]|nr:tRNA (cytidine(34)-2'-O)-methyltransferase [Chthoniobacterales bacterium]
MFNVVLVEPEIPPNTGNIARLCLATGSRLHLVEPLGFSIDDRQLRRAGMDYWHQVDLIYWKNLTEFETATRSPVRRFLLTTKSRRNYWDARFCDGDYLVFGRETKGLPESLLLSQSENCLTIPMASGARSLNLATAVAVVLFEGVRQLRSDRE